MPQDKYNFDGIQENRKNPPPGYFKLLYVGLVLWGVIYAGYFLLSGWSSSDEFNQKMSSFEQQYNLK